MSSAQYPGIGEIGGTIGTPPKAPAKTRPEPSEEDKLRARAERAEQSEREANEALRSSVATPPPQNAAPPTGPPDPGDMPDPAKDPAAFRAWTDATRAYDRWNGEQHVASVKATADSQARSKEIIDAFLTAHPQYRKLRDHVFNFYHQAALELGIQELPANTASLDSAVLKKTKELVEAAAAAVDDLPTGDEDQDGVPGEGRAIGLSGGSQGVNAGSPPPSEEDGIAIKSLFDVMRDRQAKSGLF
jgi:hypothetical protein